MTPEEISAGTPLCARSPLDIVRWAIAERRPRGSSRPTSARTRRRSSTFASRSSPTSGAVGGSRHNRPATYRHAEVLRTRLKLNLQPYLPRLTRPTATPSTALCPSPRRGGLQQFSKQMKLEPFSAACANSPHDLAHRPPPGAKPAPRGLDIVSHDPNFGAVKVSRFSTRVMRLESYLAAHQLPKRVGLF